LCVHISSVLHRHLLQPVSYISLGFTVATGGGLLYWYTREKDKKLAKLATKSVVVGNAAIGGPFLLTNQDGKPFSDKDLLGEFALLYFGFTFCPDVCPEELEKIAAAADAVGA
jgi:protein SCO1/2